MIVHDHGDPKMDTNAADIENNFSSRNAGIE